MQIDIFSIQKGDDEFCDINQKYTKLIKPFCSINEYNIFTKDINKAQNIDTKHAKLSYDKEYLPKLDGGFNIALCEHGQMLDSMEFAKLLESKNYVKFFIGGAYGFSNEFKSRCDKVVSFSRLTYAHKLVKTILLEQIYRSFCINNNHPYHK